MLCLQLLIVSAQIPFILSYIGDKLVLWTNVSEINIILKLVSLSVISINRYNICTMDWIQMHWSMTSCLFQITMGPVIWQMKRQYSLKTIKSLHQPQHCEALRNCWASWRLQTKHPELRMRVQWSIFPRLFFRRQYHQLSSGPPYCPQNSRNPGATTDFPCNNYVYILY